MGKIKYLVMDVDGTLTDGKIYMSASGEAMKAFNIKDGYGIGNLLVKLSIEPVILTGRSSEIVSNRCKELGINSVFQGIKDKAETLIRITDDLSTIAYIGDDLNDILCMKLVKQSGGIIGCPADAVEDVKLISDFVSSFPGGEGAVRDFIDWIQKNN